jgi:hypothetical protein
VIIRLLPLTVGPIRWPAGITRFTAITEPFRRIGTFGHAVANRNRTRHSHRPLPDCGATDYEEARVLNAQKW